MTADIDLILNQVKQICADIEVFISYAHRDRKKVQPLITALAKKDFSVWTPDDNLTVGDAWNKQISDAIIRCAYKGFYIIVITEESVKSSFVADELAFAYSQGAWIVPVVLGNPNIPDDICRWLGSVQRVSITPSEEDFAWVVDMLDSVVKKKIDNHA